RARLRHGAHEPVTARRAHRPAAHMRAALATAGAALLLAGCTSSGLPSLPPPPSTTSATQPTSGAAPSSATGGTSAPSGDAGASSAAPADTVTILGSGDVLVHPQLIDQARADGG